MYSEELINTLWEKALDSGKGGKISERRDPVSGDTLPLSQGDAIKLQQALNRHRQTFLKSLEDDDETGVFKEDAKTWSSMIVTKKLTPEGNWLVEIRPRITDVVFTEN